MPLSASREHTCLLHRIFCTCMTKLGLSRVSVAVSNSKCPRQHFDFLLLEWVMHMSLSAYVCECVSACVCVCVCVCTVGFVVLFCLSSVCQVFS